MVKMLRFHAEWCSPCKAMKPTIDKVFSDPNLQDVILEEIDVDEDNENLSGKYAIRSVPTIVAINENNEVIDKLIGAVREKDLWTFIDECKKRVV